MILRKGAPWANLSRAQPLWSTAKVTNSATSSREVNHDNLHCENCCTFGSNILSHSFNAASEDAVY